MVTPGTGSNLVRGTWGVTPRQLAGRAPKRAMVSVCMDAACVIDRYCGTGGRVGRLGTPTDQEECLWL